MSKALRVLCGLFVRPEDGSPRAENDETTSTRPCVAEPLEGRTLFAVAAGFTDTTIVSGLHRPTAMAVAPDGRLFVSEQDGQLRVVKNGSLLSAPFATVPAVGDGERGLLGVAFDPQFASNGYVYVYWTAASPTIHNRISRFTANGDVGSGRVDLFDLPAVTSAFHNGGALHFGPDGKLYVAVGDNTRRDPAQSTSSVFGKILRLNKDGTIPSDNPFAAQNTGIADGVWAYGLRNPFTFAFQPGSGRMHINDVGQNTWEEVNLGVRGANYGWPTSEGPTGDARFRSPIYSYNHGQGSAITAGVFYNPASPNFPAGYVGDYLFADFSGYIKSLDFASGNRVTTLATGLRSPVDLDVAGDGSVYYLQRGAVAGQGSVHRIRSAGAAAGPSIGQQPADRTASVGQSVTFSVAASGSGTLRYQWQRNGANIAGATGASYTLPAVQSSDNGALFRVVVSDAAGRATSAAARLSVTTNRPPSASINTPAAGTLFSHGQAFQFAGGGSDPEDGALPDSAFSWRVDYHTGAFARPFVAERPGSRGGSFTIPTETPYTKTDVFYRIHLKVTDSDGLTTGVTRDLRPRTAGIRLETNVPGLTLSLDGAPAAAPIAVRGVTGLRRQIGAAATQTLNGVTYDFVGWSDGGAATHTIATPAADTTYTATYRARSGGGGGTGNGLRATYYNNANFTGTSFTRTDPAVNFNAGTGSPHPSIAPDTFSVRWAGKVLAAKSETYTFHTRANDGVRLWVNGQLLIDRWFDTRLGQYSGSIRLTAGQRYDIRMEYYEGTGSALAQLLWSSPTTPLQVIPTSQLFPA